MTTEQKNAVAVSLVYLVASNPDPGFCGPIVHGIAETIGILDELDVAAESCHKYIKAEMARSVERN